MIKHESATSRQRIRLFTSLYPGLMPDQVITLLEAKERINLAWADGQGVNSRDLLIAKTLREQGRLRVRKTKL